MTAVLCVIRMNGKLHFHIECGPERHNKLNSELFPVVRRYPLTDEQAALPIDTLAKMLAEGRFDEKAESEEVKKARSDALALAKAQDIAGKPPVS